MPAKKTKAQPMSMAELSAKFGGDPTAGKLPTTSEGKDFAKGKGKGFRDSDDSRAEQNEWRSGGKGFGKGRDREDRDSRADTGDWFSKDRPAGGGGDRGNDRRGGGGDRGPPRRDDRRDGDDTPSDWRSSMGQDNRDRDDRPRFGRGFGERDSRRDEGSNFRRGGDDTPSERPRLNLKPRSKLGEGDDEAPRRADGAGKENQGDNEVTPKAGRYVPPSMRRKEEEETRKAPLREPSRRFDDDGFEEQQRRGSSNAAASGGKYISPAARQQQKEEDRKRQAREEREREEAELKRKKEEAQAEAERARKRELKERKEAAKESAKLAQSNKPTRRIQEDEGDAEGLKAFSLECEQMLADASVDIDARLKKATANLTEAELRTVRPTRCLLEPLLQHCRAKVDEEVVGTVQRFKPLFNELIAKAGTHRFKVKVLAEAQKAAYAMGLPRLSPKSALLEVIFDGLYQAEVIEEDYFEMWAHADDDTPGKTSAMFQVNYFLEFLRNGLFEGEESEEEEDDEDKDSDDEDDDDAENSDDDDIEENVPKRIGLR